MVPHWVFDYAAGTIVTCSILHTFLPPWDFLNDFPRAQKYYKLLVYVIGYIAVNGRSTVYHSLSITNPGGVNQAGNGNTPNQPNGGNK